jgi:enterobacteria phage integrase
MSRPRNNARKAFPPNLYINGVGYYSWRDPDSKKVHGLGRDKAAAFAEARAANAMVAGREPKALVEKIRQGDGKTLATWCDEWLVLASAGKSKSTVTNYKSSLRELRARCGHLMVDEITPKMVDEVLTFYKEAGKLRMGETIHTNLLEVFRVAEVKGLIPVGKNPVAPTEPAKSEVKRLRLGLPEFLKIHAAQKTHWGRLGMELALVSAQRRGDVAQMRRADIVDGHLQVDQRKSGGETKLGIPLSLRLEAVGWSLQEVIDRCRTAGLISPFILHHRTQRAHCSPGDAVDPDGLSKKFSESLASTDIEIETGRTAPTFHEIRSLAIRLWTIQAGKEFAQALAGHRNMKTTLLYTDPRDSEVQRILIPDPNAPKVLNEY